MDFKIVHRGHNHIRVASSFYITLDVQDYLRFLFLQHSFIAKVQFYGDEKHFSLDFKEGFSDFKQLKILFKAISKKKIKELTKLPIRKEETAYSIVSNALVKRFFFKTFVPFPIRYIHTVYNAIKYVKEAKKSLSHKRLTMEVLDCSAILISMAMNKSATASSIMFILNLGNKLDSWTMKKSILDLEQSLKAKDYDVWLINGNERRVIKSSEVKVDDVILVSEGNEILFDGQVVSGAGMVNESSLTGESFPVEKILGSVVFSNTILESGELYIKVTNNQLNARIYKLIELMKDAEKTKETKQKSFIELADRVVKYNFIFAALTYLLTRSFTKAISFLLVDFSCAIKISTPVAYLSAIKYALDKQVMIKTSDVFDVYKDIDVFLFDKTGTITTSHPLVEKVIPFSGYTKEEVIRISACLEEHIHHPIANAIVNKADQSGIIHEEMHDQLQYIASKGIKSSIDGKQVLIGNYLLMKDEEVEISSLQQETIDNYKAKYNLLFLSYKKELIAIFCISTPLRPETKEILKCLLDDGKEVILATGDTYERTTNVIENLTFSKVYTDLKPQDKYDIISNLKAVGKKVLMIGDGLNDSAAISLADIGIVMNDSADISKQMSDVVLLNNKLTSLLMMKELSNKLELLIKKNITETIVVNGGLISLGLFNVLQPTVLSVFHNLTTLKIVLRSLTIK